MSILTPNVVKERFLKDIENHKMTVMQDNGLYRHLNFSKGSINQHFNLITYPDHLVISGDMGTFIFKRTEDMFKFFRSDELGINTGYWDEKLQAISRWAGLKEFDQELVEESIKNRVNDICANIEEYFFDYKGDEYKTCKEFEEAFRQEVSSHFEYKDLDQHRHTSEIEDFESFIIADLDFTDAWEWFNSEKYTIQYLWCCFAIVWGIQQYDKHLKSSDKKKQ
ncbi:hypothetical protein KO527_05330 [Pseudoalteromonas sp. C2R02]|uniref:hypothetical protein n=1 Tax=Pseudoalteromonas sp. C2R02 TaxID=2841565 RepID=UPI001C096EE7|nr:hypothetical protein [Pseudoalteromonas sp. C2R02]MBU2968770.1 hypothetical protein [Pseudoalteromonas sp. C2R02]